jgi:hypothetical protein
MRANEAEKERAAIGDLHADGWERREALQRKLGLRDTGPAQRREAPRPKMILELLLDGEAG